MSPLPVRFTKSRLDLPVDSDAVRRCLGALQERNEVTKTPSGVAFCTAAGLCSGCPDLVAGEGDVDRLIGRSRGGRNCPC